MTREEAISLLTQVKEIILGSKSWLDSTHQPTEEAFNMAIEAIKSTQTNASNVLSALDTISRQEAIDALIEWYGCEPNGMDYFKEILAKKSSAQPEQKKGKWIKIDDDLISGRCSRCGWEAHLYEDDIVGMDYCPNCGAKMEVVG